MKVSITLLTISALLVSSTLCIKTQDRLIHAHLVELAQMDSTFKSDAEAFSQTLSVGDDDDDGGAAAGGAYHEPVVTTNPGGQTTSHSEAHEVNENSNTVNGKTEHDVDRTDTVDGVTHRTHRHDHTPIADEGGDDDDDQD